MSWKLPSEVETTVVRVMQESLTSIYRHAESMHASIRFVRDEGLMILKVQDQGRGIAAATGMREDVAPVGLGIAGMRQRVR